MLRFAGKTVVLLLEGLHALRHGGDVHLVAWGEEAWAASFILEEQLRLALEDNPPSPPHAAGRIVVHRLKRWRQSGESDDDWEQRVKREAAGVAAAIQAQAAASPGDTLVILDEANFRGRLVLSRLDVREKHNVYLIFIDMELHSNI